MGSPAAGGSADTSIDPRATGDAGLAASGHGVGAPADGRSGDDLTSGPASLEGADASAEDGSPPRRTSFGGVLDDASLADLVIAGATTFLLIAYWPGLVRASPVLLPLVAFPVGLAGLVGMAVLVRRGDRPARWAAAYLAWAGIATLASAQPRLSFQAGYGADRGWLYLAAFVGCWALGRRRGPAGARLFTIGLIAGLALNALLAFGQVWIDGTGLFQLYEGRAAAFPLNPVYLGGLMSGAVALAAALAGRGGARWWGWLGPVAVFATVAELSGSRVALAAAFVLGLAAVRVGGVLRVGAVAVAMVIGIVLGSQLLTSSSTARLDPTSEAASGGLAPRLAMWEAGIDAALERPLVGWGPNRFRPATNAAVDLEFTLSEGPERLYFDAHNLLVEQLTTVGFPGLVLLMGFAWTAARRARGPVAWYAAGVAATWLLEPVAVSTAPTALLALGFACIPPDAAGPDAPFARSGPRVTLRTVAVVACLAVTALAARSVYVDHLVVEYDDEVDLVADYERAAELMPNDPAVSDMYAQALAFQALVTGDRATGERAIAAAERSVELDPTHSRLWNQLGAARLRFSTLPRDERLASAREAYETALTRSPWSTVAMSALFQISLQQGRPDEARDWLVALCAAGRCPRISS